jgi:NodT family efflux transporter outer membrane factor (OMF) lipoprotein
MKRKAYGARWRPIRWMAVGGGLILAACAVGPAYKRPSVPVPPQFKELAPPGTTAEANAFRPAQPKDDALRGKWWEVFGDRELDALEEQVAVSNQTLAQAEAQFRGARAAVLAARGNLFPAVSVSAGATRAHSSANRGGVILPGSVTGGVATGGDTTVYQVPVDLSYEFDLWGRIRRQIEADVASAQASAADVETMRLSLEAELAVDYFQLHGLDQQSQLLGTAIQAFDRALQLTVNRHDQGVVSGIDVAQAQTQLDTTRAQATDLGAARAQFEHAIAILVGKPPSELTIPAAPIGVQPPAVPVALPSELLERRPDIAAAERRVASANALIGVAQAAYYPSLTLSASGGFQSSTLAKLFSLPSRFWSIGPAIAETLFDGGRRRAATEQARANYDVAVAVYRENVLTAFQNVEDNLSTLRILDQEAREQAAAVTSSERSLALAESRYQGGITTYLEIVTAQQTALGNERTAVDLLTRRMTASVNLVKALGGGWNTTQLPSATAVGAR